MRSKRCWKWQFLCVRSTLLFLALHSWLKATAIILQIWNSLWWRFSCRRRNVTDYPSSSIIQETEVKWTGAIVQPRQPRDCDAHGVWSDAGRVDRGRVQQRHKSQSAKNVPVRHHWRRPVSWFLLLARGEILIDILIRIMS